MTIKDLWNPENDLADSVVLGVETCYSLGEIRSSFENRRSYAKK